MKTVADNLRNIAIIAHVDHGKTTLVDALLKQTKVFRENQAVRECVLDSNDLERERGITIFSKNASITYKGVKINIIDTPGHADFGGEVERVLRMADGVLLLVDAVDGPMPQTRFVLRKAMEARLKSLIVINKMDRPDARPLRVLDEVFDLFVRLGATDEQLEFPVIYASGREGFARREPGDASSDCKPLLDAVLAHVPPPVVETDAPLQMQVASIDYSTYVGRIAIGRIFRGAIRERQEVAIVSADGSSHMGRVEGLQVFSGISRERVAAASAGEIVIVTGIPEIGISDTVADPETPQPLPAIKVDEPTLAMEFVVNNSPFAGREGIYFTGRHLEERLDRELLSNVALRMSEPREGAFQVSGRGLLHLGVVIENMRREGYEFAVGKPRVIFKEIDGRRCEPMEILIVDVASACQGKVLEIAGSRRGAVEKMEARGDRVYLEFRMPSRGLIGLRSRLMNATRGETVMHHVLAGYEPFAGEIPHRSNGVLISTAVGSATAFAMDALQSRGVFFIRPGARVYEGMIVGENSRSEDICVNVCRMKKLTNMRAASADRKAEISPPREMSLEECLEYLEDDELLEVTQKSLRLRKRVLGETARKRAEREKTEG